MIITFDFSRYPLKLITVILIFSLLFFPFTTDAKNHEEKKQTADPFVVIMTIYTVGGGIVSVLEYLKLTPANQRTPEGFTSAFINGCLSYFSDFILKVYRIPTPPGTATVFKQLYGPMSDWAGRQLVNAATWTYSESKNLLWQKMDAFTKATEDVKNQLLAAQSPQLDTQPPIVRIISPNGGENLTSMFAVSVEASDNFGVKQVEFQYSTDHTNWFTLVSPDDDPALNDGIDTDGSDGWSLRFDVLGAGIIQDQTVWARARATDFFGNTSAWDESNSSFAINNSSSQPGLRTTPTFVDFATILGSQNLSKQFEVKNIGGGNLSWQISENSPWMSLSTPQNGSLAAGQSVYPSVYVNTSGRQPGDVLVDHVTVTTNAGTEYIEVIGRIGGNQPPIVRSGGVEPDQGNTADNTVFTFRVTYIDHDNDAPATQRVLIDGSAFNMGTTDTYYDNGSLFTLERTARELGVGPHRFYFEFSDGKGGNDRYPDSGELVGATVASGEPTMYVYEPDGMDDRVSKTNTSQYTIKWIATDPENDPLTIDLFYNTVQDKSTMKPISSNLNNTGSYSWTISSIPQGSYYVYGISRDNHGQTEDDWSTGAVTISDSPIFPPTEIWENQRFLAAGGEPAIVRGLDSSLHVVYNAGEQFVRYIRSTNLGRTWSNYLQLSNLPGPIDNPRAAADASGNIHIVWHQRGSSSDDEIYYAKHDKNAQPVIIDRNVSGGGNKAQKPDIVVDINQNVHVVWNDWNTGQIYYSRSSDGGSTWSGKLNIGVSSTGAPFPRIVADANNLYVTIHNEDSRQIIFIRGNNFGQNWDSAKRIDNSTFQPKEPDIEVAGNVVHVIYNTTRSADGFLYTRSTDQGNTWSTPVRASDATGNFGEITSSGDSIFVIVQGGSGSPPFFETFDKGQSWSSSINIGTGLPRPRISVDNYGGVHVVARGDAGIYYLRTQGPQSPPTIKILTAASGIVLVDSSFLIKWIASDPNPDDNLLVSLYYDTDKDPSVKLPISLSSTNDGIELWSTKSVPAGEYYIYAVARDLSGNSGSTYSDGKVKVNHRPTMQVNPPSGIDTAGIYHNITWFASDPDLNDTLRINLFYDIDKDTTEKFPILLNSRNVGSYLWDLTEVKKGVYYLYGIATDGVNEPFGVYSSGRVYVGNRGAGTIVFQDDFSDGDAVGWTVAQGTMTVVNGKFVSSPTGFAVWTLAGEIYGDLVLEADARIVQRYNDPGGADHIVLPVNVPFDPTTREIISNRYYAFTTRQGTLNDIYFYHALDGQFLASSAYSLSPILATHRYKVQKTGSTYTCYIDGSLRLTWTGTSPYDGGYVAIYGGQGYTGAGTPPAIEWDNITLLVQSTTQVDQIMNTIPKAYSVKQNYPNPFNSATTIEFALPKASRVSLKVYDVLGREVVTLLEQEELYAGIFKATWNGRNSFGINVSSGIYFYRLEASDFTQTKKLILLR